MGARVPAPVSSTLLDLAFWGFALWTLLCNGVVMAHGSLHHLLVACALSLVTAVAAAILLGRRHGVRWLVARVSGAAFFREVGHTRSSGAATLRSAR